MIAGPMNGPTERSDLDAIVTDARGGAVIRVRVKPRSKRHGVLGVVGSELSVGVGSAPEDGRATAEALATLADWLGVPRARVTLASGVRSRSKRFLVARAQAAALRADIRRWLIENPR
jgi:uncharacterized protein